MPAQNRPAWWPNEAQKDRADAAHAAMLAARQLCPVCGLAHEHVAGQPHVNQFDGFAGPPTSRDKGGEDWIEQARRLPTTPPSAEHVARIFNAADRCGDCGYSISREHTADGACPVPGLDDASRA